MSTKTRLGKGLGALFPVLPGAQDEASKQHDEVSSNSVIPAAPKVTPVHETAKTSGVAHVAASGDLTAEKQQNTAAIKQKAEKKEASVSHKNSKSSKSSARRAEMPGLNDIAHPADMFFSPGVVALDPTPQVAAPAAEAKLKSKKDDGNEEPQLAPVQGGYLVELKLTDVGPNTHQPRTIFDEDDLRELAESIKEVGVLQPIVVRKRPLEQIEAAIAAKRADNAGKGSQDATERSGEVDSLNFDDRMDSMYELIMGERRWRASQIAGLTTIPAIVKTTADTDMLRDALLENLHRVALNPLEEAAAYQQMIDEFGLTQAQLSKSVSKSRPQIANTLRLLNLPAGVQKKVAAGVLSAGHARALLGLRNDEDMESLADRIIAEGLSVRSTEEIVAMKVAESDQPKKPKTNRLNPWLGSPVQQGLENHFDTKVSIKGTKQHGRIEIVFSSPEDMDRILGMLMPQSDGDDTDTGNGWV